MTTPSRAGGAAGRAADRVGRAGASVGRASGRVARASGRAAKATGRRLRRASSAGGAGETGLGRVIELHAVNAAADTLLAISLAGTLFFTVPSDEARGRVALYLLLTMAPFALVAPVIGPFLDRFRRGRRWAIGGTFAVRGFLAWVMAGAVVSEDFTLYPAAFACLVASKAYGVTRAAVVPRLLPPEVPLVTANARVSAFGVLGAAIAAPIGVAAATAGPDWSLRLAFLVYALGAVLAGLLPSRVDDATGEQDASGMGVPQLHARGRTRVRVSGDVVRALRANAALRAFTGMLTMFLAFLLREQPPAGLAATTAVGLAAFGAGAGSTLGTGLGAVLKARRPDRIVVAVLGLAALAAVVAALLWGMAAAVMVALVAGLSQQLGKLSLDAIIQREVPDQVVASAFARSETLLQLSWVIGGALGIVLPLVPQLGLGLAAGWLLAVLVLVAGTRAGGRPASVPESVRRRARRPRRGAPS